jgi:hypothetical protein
MELPTAIGVLRYFGGKIFTAPGDFSQWRKKIIQFNRKDGKNAAGGKATG